MSTYSDFKALVTGKSYDIDGYYGAQCWDFAMYYSQYLGYPVYSCTASGYVKDIWELRNSSGILNYYNEVPIADLQPGDIVVFKECSATPLSHIAIFDHGADSTNGAFLGQNQPYAYVNILTLPYSACYPTAFRPKKFSTENTGTAETTKINGIVVIPEKGTVEFTVDGVNIRNGKPNGDVIGTYNKGDKVNYQYKYIGNGHRYIVYKSYSGAYRFVAISGSEKYGVDKWANVC